MRLSSLLLAVLSCSACAAPPSAGWVNPSPQITVPELRRHVTYLASPELRGRAARSLGSAAARKYIVEHFTRIGLQPWPGEKSLEQSMLFGTNIVGVLPGASDEIVIVSAHYDHLGPHKGELHLGAADNAAGVAALIEVAEAIARSPLKPKRTICFAAWDAEEMGLLGSTAFSLREDVQRAKLAGIVNMDCLGRRSFDVLDDTIIAAGTERFPKLRQAALTSTSQLRVLPSGRELVGPRSDHVAFELRGVPWVFLTSGPYGDYHKPTDTADRIDYEKLAKEAAVVQAATLTLANADTVEQPVESTMGDRAELRGGRELLMALLNHPDEAHVPKAQLPKVRELLHRVELLDTAPRYTLHDRQLMISALSDVMLPIIVPGRDMLTMRSYNDVYSASPELFITATRSIVQHLLASPPGPIGGEPYHHAADDIGPSTVRLDDLSGGRFALRLCVTEIETRIDYGLIFSLHPKLSIVYHQMEAAGTRDELLDWCAIKLVDATSDVVVRAIRRGVSLIDAGAADDLIADRVHHGGFEAIQPWVRHVLRTSREPSIQRAAWNAASGMGFDEMRDVAADPSRDALVRYRALAAAAQNWPDRALPLLVTMADDGTAIPPAVLTVEGSPFDWRLPERIARADSAASLPRTLGQAARAELGKRWGDDPAVWRDKLRESLGR